MDLELKTGFLTRWEKYFRGAPLPIVFFYTDHPENAGYHEKATGHHCLIADLARVRNGTPVAFDVSSVACAGGRRYLGFSDTLRPDFRYFLSCGIPGEMEGERYISTPEQVDTLLEKWPVVQSGKRYIVFRRWDALEAADEPEAVVFFARPDVISGLYTLVNYDHAHGDGVVAPFGAGCASIVHHPWFENRKDDPKAVIGMFDVSARPHVPADVLTMAIPMKRFERIVSYMDESFLITPSWQKVMKRLP